MSSHTTVNPLGSVTRLAEQAIRLRRVRWQPEMLQVLADELYLILSQDQAAAAGPTSVAPGDGTTPLQLPPFFPLGPLGDFQFPDFLLDQPYPTPLSQDQSNADPLGNPNNPLRPGGNKSQSRVYVQRAMVPGIIRSGGPTNYAVTIYPNGQGGTNPDGTPLQKTVQATQLQTDGVSKIPAGTWALVSVSITYEVKTVVVAVGAYSASKGPGAAQTQTQIDVLSRTFQLMPPLWLFAPGSTPLKVGDTVTGPCQPVGNIPAGLLGLDGSGKLQAVMSSLAHLKGQPFLASHKAEVIAAFAAQGLTVCDDPQHKLAVAGAPLELSVGPSSPLIWFCGWDWVDALPTGPTGLVFARICEAAMKACLNGKKGVALYAGGGSPGSGAAFSHFRFLPAGWPSFTVSLPLSGTTAQNFLNDTGTVGGHSLKDVGLLLVDDYFEEALDYSVYMGPITAAAANINKWLLGGGALVAVSEIMDLTDYGGGGAGPLRDGLPILHGFSWVPVAVPGVQCYVDVDDSAVLNPRALTTAGKQALPALTDVDMAAMTDTSQSCFATGGASITTAASGGFQTMMTQRGRNCVIAGRLPGTKAPSS